MATVFGDGRTEDRHRTRCCECENVVFTFRNTTTREVYPFGDRRNRSEIRCITEISCKRHDDTRRDPCTYELSYCRKNVLDGEWLPEGSATLDKPTGNLPHGCPKYSETDSQKCQGSLRGHVPPSGTCHLFARRRKRPATARMDDTRTEVVDGLRAVV